MKFRMIPNLLIYNQVAVKNLSLKDPNKEMEYKKRLREIFSSNKTSIIVYLKNNLKLNVEKIVRR